MKRIAVYPGSFDPVTNGHLDILHRAVSLFDKVIMAIVYNPNKSGLFSPEERADLLHSVVKDNSKVEVDIFSGLLVDYVCNKGAKSIIRGLRAVADFEYEFQMALMNRRLQPSLDTVFLMTDENNFYVSSTLVKEVVRLGGDVSGFVPKSVSKALQKKRKSGAAIL